MHWRMDLSPSDVGEGPWSGDHFVRLEVDALLASLRLADLFRGYLSL